MRFIREYRGKHPQIPHSAFVAPTATLLGNVKLGEQASVWYGTVLRGDVMPITIGARTNIQDLCVAHGTTGKHAVKIGDDVTVGHRVVLHGCTVANRCLIGMGAVILDGATIGEGAIVAAGAVVPPGMDVPAGKLVAGVPAKEIRDVSAEESKNIDDSAKRYIELAESYGDPSH